QGQEGDAPADGARVMSAQATTDPEALMRRVEELEEVLGRTADPATSAAVDELVGTLVALYGDGLGRIMATLDAHEDAEALRAALMDDGVVASLLLVHDL